jgi:hypothetical protein
MLGASRPRRPQPEDVTLLSQVPQATESGGVVTFPSQILVGGVDEGHRVDRVERTSSTGPARPEAAGHDESDPERTERRDNRHMGSG